MIVDQATNDAPADVRVLVVDDVPENIRVLSRMLADQGYQVSAATSGRQGLRLAGACVPDLILLDIMMPDMDGYAVCQALKTDPQLRHIPVIFVTALNDAEDEGRGLALGAVDYITKPFKEALVLLRVKTHLELKRQRDMLALLSRVDSLTGIGNRRALDETLVREWHRAQRGGRGLAAAMVDIDHFKEFNDRHGHLVGDDCLRAVARSLLAGLRRGADFVFRFGGEEFACLLEGADLDALRRTMEALRVGVEALHIAHGASRVSPWVTVSIGAGLCCPKPHGSPEQLIAFADDQLFMAKRAGRNRVRLAGA